MKTKLLSCFALITLLFVPFFGKSQTYTEGFENITTLTGSGWFIQNNSSPLGLTGYSQGASTVFPAFSGTVNSFISANFNNTTGGTGTISNWLVTPNRTYKNGDVFTFYTRSTGDIYPDRLEVRLSTNGASTNVGATATAVGDFTTSLLSVNPLLTTTGYPAVWTQYTITLSGLSAPTSGRIAFRYFVTNAGPSGANSDYIGIDNVVYTPYVCPTFALTTGGALTAGTAGSAYSQVITQTGALGTPTFAVTAGALPGGLTLSSSGTISGTPNATGTFNFTITVTDNSGCSGTQSYSITISCPSNPINFATAPQLCSNGTPYTLIQASPAGGTYSGTGVTSGIFDPSVGSQTITYNYTDAYACAFNSNFSITVNTPPTVNQSAISATCSNAGAVALSGGSPSGGSYSGTGVTGSNFDPSVGSQTVTYSFTDVNNCTNTASTMITVNTPPNADAGTPQSLTCAITSVVLNGSSSTSGATFSWAGAGIVSGGTTATPTVNAAGTYTLIATDPVNGWNTSTVVVNQNITLPNANAGANQMIVCGATTVNLAGSSSTSGATFSWAGPGIVSGGTTATPTVNAAGTYTLTVTDPANGCTNTSTVTVTNSAGIPNANAGSPQTLTCAITSVVLNGSSSTSGTTFSWAGPGIVSGGSTATPTVNAAGTYTLTVTDPANGCTNTSTVVVSQNITPPNANAGTPQTITCSATTVTLFGSSSTGGATFSWAGPGIVSGGTTATPTVNAAGTYTLTVTNPANGCTATSTVIVTANNTPPNVTYTPTVTTLCVNNAPITLAGGSPANGTYSGNGVSGGIFNPSIAGVGSHVITYSFTDANNCSGTAQSTIMVNTCLGIETNELGNLSIYPNPATDELNLQFENMEASDAEILLISNDGRIIFSTIIKSNSTLIEKLDVSGYSEGIYLIKIKSETISIVQKVVVN